MADTQDTKDASADPTAFLIAELNHYGDSLWRNEEVGEKRFNFFITLVTAVLAGLVALHTSNNGPGASVPAHVTSGALGGLLLFGVMTYLRIMRRNIVTDEYKAKLKSIRETLLKLAAVPGGYEVRAMPRSESETESKRTRFLNKWLRGGYAETVGVVNALLAVGAVLVWDPESPMVVGLAAVLGLVLLVTFWRTAVGVRKAAN